MGRSNRKKPRRLWLKIPLIIIIVLVLAVGGYAFSVYNNAKNTVKDMHDPVETIDTDLTKKKLQDTEKLNILLLGIDAEGDQNGRSDAIMVMQLDPEDDSMMIVSIPRDTYAEIAGRGTQDKINHAWAFGGADMAIDTVEQFLDVQMDYYVSINMDGLVELVDELGTVTVNNDFAWTDKHYDFPEGKVEMDGDQSKAFVRMRKKDPEGDFGRTKRQRKVIEGIINEGAQVGSVPKFSSMLDVLGTNMNTNMDFDDMKKLFSSYRDTRKDITEYMIDGTGENIDGIYYLMVPDEEVQKAHDILTKS